MTPKSNHTSKIYATVELGSPAADCAHFGICSLEEIAPAQWARFRPRHIRHVKALLSRSKQGALRFEFPYNGMRPDTRKEFFPASGFRVDSARSLPDLLARTLGICSSLSFVPGLYLLKFSGAGIKLELPLKPGIEDTE
jgi:hypothetical protein